MRVCVGGADGGTHSEVFGGKSAPCWSIIRPHGLLGCLLQEFRDVLMSLEITHMT